MTTDKESIDLIISVKDGSDDAFEKLVSKYQTVIESSVRSFAKYGEGEGQNEALAEDLRQEARLALYRAAETYDTDKYKDSVTFGLYCKICIKNALISDRRRRMRAERKAEKLRSVMQSELNGSVPSSSSSEVLASVEEMLKSSDSVLSKYEMQILKQMISGKPVREISLSVGRNEKSVSNAIYRIKMKLRGLTN